MTKQQIKAAFSGTSQCSGSVALDDGLWERAFSWQCDSDWINDKTGERINYKAMLNRLGVKTPNDLHHLRETNEGE